MKKRTRSNKIFVKVFILLLILTAAFLTVRIDKRFYCEQLLKYKLGRFELDEIAETDIDTVTVSKDGVKIGEELILVNKDHPLPEDYSPTLSEYKDTGVIMSAASVDSFAELSADIFEHTGEKLYVMSSYRDKEDQEEIEEEMGSSVALPPNCSEHETGLAQDLYFDSYAGNAINKCKAGRYLTEHAAEHGFILRYPPSENTVTGIEYEPWHFRYVGLPHSEIIDDNGLTYEEYIDALEYGKFYEYGDYTISRQQGDDLTFPSGCKITVSEDNCGGYIVTARK